jgi:Outer membrane protein and related peptidoglycan-associated (lipo)proteins
MTPMLAMKLKVTAASAALAALLGCAPSSDPVYTQFYSEAGALADTGYFGNATLNNRLVMTGERQYTFDLANRFANEVTSVVNFDFNSSQLDGNAQAILRQQAGWIRQFPEIRFRVYGHTDAVGSNRYNKGLGLRRANAVVSYLSTLGISRSRLEAVVSFGETQSPDRDTGPRAQEPPYRDRGQTALWNATPPFWMANTRRFIYRDSWQAVCPPVS